MMSGWDDAPTVRDVGWAGGPEPADGAGAAAIRLGPRPKAGEVRQALLDLPALAAARIDASEVEKLSAPMLQVLLAAFRDAAREGAPVVVASPSFAFSLAFETYGFGGEREPFTVEYS